MKCDNCKHDIIAKEKNTSDNTTSQKKNKNNKYVVKNSSSIHHVNLYDLDGAGIRHLVDQKKLCYKCYKKHQDKVK